MQESLTFFVTKSGSANPPEFTTRLALEHLDKGYEYSSALLISAIVLSSCRERPWLFVIPRHFLSHELVTSLISAKLSTVRAGHARWSPAGRWPGVCVAFTITGQLLSRIGHRLKARLPGLFGSSSHVRGGSHRVRHSVAFPPKLHLVTLR